HSVADPRHLPGEDVKVAPERWGGGGGGGGASPDRQGSLPSRSKSNW
ncbi:SLC12A5 isoform 23, partial [Pongo abelii]